MGNFREVFRKPLLTAAVTATAAGSTSEPVRVRDLSNLTLYTQSNGTTSGGTLVLEEATWNDDAMPYGGTWSPIGSTINASASSADKQVATHVTAGAYDYVRYRVATDITGGGSISAWLVGN